MGLEITRFPEAYPVYRLGYKDELESFNAGVSEYGNLLTAGRLGRFWYNNMDHCIGESMHLAETVRESLGN